MLFEWLDSMVDSAKSILNNVFSRLRNTLTTVLTVLSACFVLLWIAVFLYGSFYYTYIPTVLHEKDVNLHFSADCEISDKPCTFPSANVTLIQPGQTEILSRGQSYVVLLELELPESPVNQHIGNFMVMLNVYSRHGEVVRTATRATMLRYKSPLLQVIETFSYAAFYIFGAREQKQKISVELFTNYQEDPYRPAHGVFIEVQSRRVEIYSTTLKIHATFTGLRYLLFYWPMTSALVGISSNMFFLMVVALLSWYNFGPKQTTVEQSPKERKAANEKRRAKVQALLEREKEKQQSSLKPENLTGSSSTDSADVPAESPDVSSKTTLLSPHEKDESLKGELRQRRQLQS